MRGKRETAAVLLLSFLGVFLFLSSCFRPLAPRVGRGGACSENTLAPAPVSRPCCCCCGEAERRQRGAGEGGGGGRVAAGAPSAFHPRWSGIKGRMVGAARLASACH